MNQDTTEEQWVRDSIARIEKKRDAQRDSENRRYYELCLLGWQAHLNRLLAEKGRTHG